MLQLRALNHKSVCPIPGCKGGCLSVEARFVYFNKPFALGKQSCMLQGKWDLGKFNN